MPHFQTTTIGRCWEHLKPGDVPTVLSKTEDLTYHHHLSSRTGPVRHLDSPPMDVHPVVYHTQRDSHGVIRLGPRVYHVRTVRHLGHRVLAPTTSPVPV